MQMKGCRGGTATQAGREQRHPGCFLSVIPGVLSIPVSSFPEHYTHAHKCTITTIYKAKESRECQGITGGKQTNGHAGLSAYLGM